MDADTLLAIQEGNKEVIKEFKDTMKQNTADLKDYMQLHISPLKGDVERLRGDVSDLYNKDREMRDRVGILEQRQSQDEGAEKGSSKAREDEQSRRRITISVIGVCLTGLGVLIGLVIR